QRLLHLYAVRPCRRCVVLAANGNAYALALDLHRAGVEVAAVADLREGGEPGELGRRVAEAGIPNPCGCTVGEALPGADRASVRGVAICRLDEEGRPVPDSGPEVDCDGIAVSVGWTPAGGLLSQAGGRFTYAG